MSIPESEQEHAWVTDVLAGDVAGPMPTEVSDRVLAAMAALTRPASSGSSSVARLPERGVDTSAAGAVPSTAVPPTAVPPTAVPPTAVAADPPHSAVWPTNPAVARTGSSSSSLADIAHGPSGGPPVAHGGAGARAVGGSGVSRTGSVVRVLTGGRRSGRVEAESDRRHFLLYRILPVAASMVVVAAASGVVATQLDGQEQRPTIVAQEAAVPGGPKPNGLVATGTSYTGAQLTEQAAGLLTQVAEGRNEVATPQPARVDASAAVPAPAADPDPSVGESAASAFADAVPVDPITASPLASAAAYRECARTLGAAEGVLPAAVDLATFEGTEAAIVVLPNRAGDGYEVIVTDRFCSPDTERASETFVDG